jgi:uncharacterized protein (DUF362 family)
LNALVSISHCEDYERERVAAALRAALGPLGGIGAFVKPGARVLLKPNYVLARRRDEAANTHPVFIAEVARLVREAGGEVAVGDSPALGSARYAAWRTGLLPLAREAGIPIVEFRQTHRVELPPGSRAYRLAVEALEADVLINLPKLKVHAQMYLTLAVKNLFGCIRGRRKALYHLQLGGRPAEFARMLVDVARLAAPELTLLDGIVGLERTGPTGGDPRRLGLVIAGEDPVAIDRVCCDLLGVDPDRLLTLAAAREARWGETDLARILVLSDGAEVRPPLAALAPALLDRPFVLPRKLTPLTFSPLRIARGLVRQFWALWRRDRKKHSQTN